MEEKAANQSIIAQGTSCNGTLSSECPLLVSGVVDGELNAPYLEITESGSVNGKVKVEELRSSGEISGDIEAGTMQLSGKVLDNTSIRAQALEVKLSGQASEELHLVFGSATVEVGEDPSTSEDREELQEPEDLGDLEPAEGMG
jgi:cytoskeletal protein CcmA (bactofilin family)